MKSFVAPLILALAVLIISLASGHAELTVAPVFGDNMVLQRNHPVPVWGRGDVGEKITVEFGDQKKSAVTDAAGNWKVVLDEMPASAEPRDLTIADSHASRITHHAVLVGDVWLAAGQSNMEFPLSREANAAEEIPAATNSQIRLLNLAFAGQYFYSKPFGSNEVARMTPEKFFHGEWKMCSPASAKEFSAIAYYFSREIQRDQNVPVGVIHCAVGGSPTEAWIRRAALESDSELRAMVGGNWFTNSVLDDWCRQRGHENMDASLTNGVTVPGDDLGPNHHFKPTFLWDAGPAMLAPFALRGVLWYQGESNSLEERRVRQHEKLFPLLVHDWRAAWGENFPFLVCQLSSIRTNHYKSAFWPDFRDQQRRFLATIPNTGMAVTSDLGALDDVHPRNKRDVGHRVALQARANAYGEKIEFTGPQPERAWRDGNKFVVQFSHAGGLKGSGGQIVRGFEIAGGDGVFYPAEVVTGEGKLILSASAVSNPVAARYGWQPFSDGNLVNGDGLPASTFEMQSGVFTITPVTQDRDHTIYNWQKRHEEVLARNKIFNPDVVIIGDSIIHYWGGEPVAPFQRGGSAWTNCFAGLKVTNLGFGWDRTENVLWRIENGELSGIKPKVIIIKIGTNNTAVNDAAEDIAAGIMAVCAAAHQQQPDAKILLLAILPRPDEKPPRPTATEKVNALLPTLAAKNPWLAYADLGGAFRNTNGTVNRTLFTGGVHPNADGYDVLGDKIRGLLNGLLDTNKH